MKGAIVKSTFLTLATYSIFFSKGYSIGDNIQIGAREVLSGNTSGAIISPFAVFINGADTIESLKLKSGMSISVTAFIAIMLYTIAYYEILVTYLPSL